MINKKILVIGGSGFLGSHVADFLTDNNYEVSIFDFKKSKYLKSDQQFIKGDILNYDHLSSAIKASDIVYHFGGIADIEMANENPLEAIKINILGTSNVLSACVEHNIERLVFASTVYVYSSFGGIYKATKQSCELLIETFSKEKQLKYTILRFGSLYGPRANDFNYITQIIKQAILNGQIERKGSGNEVRDYIHVFDASKSCLAILDKEYENHYVMITGSQRIKINDLLNMLSEMFEQKINIKYLDDRMDGHYESSPYSFKPILAKKYIGKSEIELGQGLLDLIYEIHKDFKN